MINKKEANINVKLKTFFSHWVKFTQPFHKLTKREQTVLALLLYYHHELSKEITNKKILWKEVFDYDTRVKIYSELEIKPTALENLFSQLRNKNVIKDNEILSRYIPELSNNSKQFQIVYNFNIINE